jgi:hypothetical protein
MTVKTFWILHPRNFGNEFTIGIATTEADGEQYEAEGFDRITRDRAIRELSYRPASHEQLYRSVTVDGVVPLAVQASEVDAPLIARNLRTGRAITMSI